MRSTDLLSSSGFNLRCCSRWTTHGRTWRRAEAQRATSVAVSGKWAYVAEADGVHLGQDDLPVREARRILGPDALIGVSTHTIEQVRRAVLDGASYLGVGPTFPSRTKDFSAFAGLDFVRQVCAETTLPAFAIGGIDAGNIGRVLAAGAQRVAVSHAVAQAEDPRAIATQLRLALGSSHSEPRP